MGARGVRRLVALVAAFVVFGALGLVGSQGADAQGGAALLIRKIDSVDETNRDLNNPSDWDVRVDFIYTGNAGDLGGLQLTQNDQQVQTNGPAEKIDDEKGVVLVFDTSLAMDKDGGLIRARDAAKKMVDNSTNTRFAVVAAGEKANLKQDFTTDKDRVKSVIDTVGPSEKGAAIWAALRLAGALYTDPNSSGSRIQPNILLMVGSNDTLSATQEPQGRTAVLNSGATFFAVERGDSGMDPAPYNSLVNRAGGQAFVAPTPADMEPPIVGIGNTLDDQQFRVSYTTNQIKGAPINDQLTVGSLTSAGSARIGSASEGGQALRPEIIKPSTTLGFLSSPLAYGFALLLTLLAVAGIAYALTSLFVKDDLSSVLQPYADAYGGGEFEEEGSALAKSAIIQRAVQITEQVARDQGFLGRAEAALERANVPLRAGEALFFYVAVVVGATLLGLLLTKNLIGALVFGGLAAMLPPAMVNFRAGRRRKKFMSQLPDTLQLLSGTLRAGYSLMQGVEAVSQEVEDPMGIELRRVVTEARLGRPLEESLEASAERMDSPDFAWAVMAIRIQREVGGNLSELLLTVADTMVARERLRRDVAALTAEGRVSAVVLGVLPAGLGVLMYVLNPEYVSVLFTDGLGIFLSVMAVLGMMIGFLWMRKIIQIEI